MKPTRRRARSVARGSALVAVDGKGVDDVEGTVAGAAELAGFVVESVPSSMKANPRRNVDGAPHDDVLHGAMLL